MVSDRLGARVRGLRRKHGMSQAELAQRLNISASYLNLIEHNKRKLTAPLLIGLAGLFELDVTQFAAQEDDEALRGALLEVFSDPLFEEDDLTEPEIRELSQQLPSVGRAILKLYQSFRHLQSTSADLSSVVNECGVGGAPSHLPSEEVSAFLQRNRNHFPALEIAAERISREGGLRMDDLERGLLRCLEIGEGIEVRFVEPEALGGALRAFEPEAKRLTLRRHLPARVLRFELAYTLGLLKAGEAVLALCIDPRLTSETASALCRVALLNYLAGALLMPYAPFLAAARAARYDIEVLAHRFSVGYEQICHRLTTLSRPGALGIPLHLLRVDIAGNISKRLSLSGIQFARFSGVCPRWNVHAAFTRPREIRTQLSEMPDGQRFFCWARTVQRGGPGHHASRTVYAIGLGCRVEHASEVIYADG
ncbi:DUF2083 domain-containing protein, partial [Myxococcota bacterium]|nr:DUF2083 domain-containing protein [Myxococcota bacterium]